MNRMACVVFSSVSPVSLPSCFSFSLAIAGYGETERLQSDKYKDGFAI